MRRLYLLLVLASFTAPLRAADWPQWLGPTRDAVTTEKIAPWKMPPVKVWSVSVDEGHSSPIVADGKVFLHVRDKDQEVIHAFDAAKGEAIWKSAYPRPEFNSLFGNGPRATPAYADGKVYAYGITGILTCLDATKGDKLWQRNLLRELKVPNLTFGISASPLLVEGNVVVQVGDGANLVALARDTGDIAWKSLKDKASYASPILVGSGKGAQIVVLNQAGLRAVRPDKGELIWAFDFVDRLNESSATPIRADGLLVASAVTAGAVALQLDVDKPAVQQAWKSDALCCYFSTPVPVGKHLYLVTGQVLLPQATLRCVEIATGKELWKKEGVGKYHATLLRTGDDKLLMLTESGDLVLFEPNAKEYRELARAKVCGTTWAHPALCDGLLYVRDDKELSCWKITSE
jgi:outer membrane protein assembly factor BamB